MLEDLIQERKKKLEKYAGAFPPYPPRASATHKISEIESRFDELVSAASQVAVAGRISSKRDQGKIVFLDLKDSASKLQLILQENHTEKYQLLKETLDEGDIISVIGTLFVTKRGERSLQAEHIELLSKSLRPWPSEWYGLANEEERLRHRYLESQLNPATKDLFIKKSLFWHEVRTCLLESGFLEVDLPVLEPVAGGAEAEPFITHHNALDADFYLRISLELPLKKMLVGGFDKVFEIGRVFRNEGIDRDHLQDFTFMEFYWAYEDYFAGMDFVEIMMKRVIKAVCGSLQTSFSGQVIDWDKEWPKIEYYDLFEKYAGINLSKVGESELRKKAVEVGAKPEIAAGWGRLVDLIYKKTVRPHLIQPCFLVNPPVLIEPLAKKHRDYPDRVERYQILAAGTELGKGFSELNDPKDQRERFEAQAKLRAAGDKEAQMLDEDYLECMEYGMPPNTGFGMSERIFAVLMDKPARECVYFPPMRKEQN